MVSVDCSFLHQSEWVLPHLVTKEQDQKHFPNLILQYEIKDKVYRPNNCKCIQNRALWIQIINFLVSQNDISYKS